MLKVVNIVVLALLIAAFGSAPAVAQTKTDPDADSPAAAQYQLPLDAARKDAAPRPSGGSKSKRGAAATGGDSGDGSGGGTPPANGNSTSPSTLRSENGFGSSSKVPGVADAVKGGTGSRSSTNSAGSKTAAGATALNPSTNLTRNQTNGPSGTRVYLLLVLGLLIAGAVAAAGRIGTSRRRHDPDAHAR
jgi:hypothetical protein